jgi:hypothetical protein
MKVYLSHNEDLLNRLPLPLAQLYLDAHDGKNVEGRHGAAFSLWEAALKLLESVPNGVRPFVLSDPNRPAVAEKARGWGLRNDS